MQPTTSSPVVNKKDTSSQHPGLGHNRLSGQDLLERNLRSGMYRLGYDLLITATADKRLDRTAIKVLGGIVWAMQHTGYSTPSRSALASFAGVGLRRVSNILSDLVRLGYIARVHIEEHESKVMTYGNQIDHDTIEAEIAHYCSVLRSAELHAIACKEFTPCSEQADESSLYSVSDGQKFTPSSENAPKSSLHSVKQGDDPPTDSDATLYIEESISKDIDAASCTDSDDFESDLLEDECPPPKVVVARAQSYISYKERDWKKAKKIRVSFLQNLADKDADIEELFDFAEHVIESFYAGAYPKKLKSGAARTIENHLVGSFKIYNSQQELTLFEMWRRGKAASKAGKKANIIPSYMRR